MPALRVYDQAGIGHGGQKIEAEKAHAAMKHDGAEKCQQQGNDAVVAGRENERRQPGSARDGIGIHQHHRGVRPGHSVQQTGDSPGRSAERQQKQRDKQLISGIQHIFP